jgi:hypothetical protein
MKNKGPEGFFDVDYVRPAVVSSTVALVCFPVGIACFCTG